MRHTMLRALVLGALLVAGSVALQSGEKDPKPADKPSEKLTLEECRKRVDELASKTQAPFSKSYVHRVNETELRQVQKPIRAAYNALSQNIEVALPVLVEHIDDERFSYVSESSSGVFIKNEVGAPCVALVFAHIEVYKLHVRVTESDDSRPWYQPKPSFIENEGGIERWWESRKGKPLADLQLEAIEWAIQAEEKRGFSSTLERQSVLGPMKVQAATLRATSRPIAVKPQLFFFGK